MANELRAPYDTGANLYALVFDASGLVWDGSSFASLEADDWGSYDTPLVEQDGTGWYYGDFPTGITTAGTYSYTLYERAGGSPAVSDGSIGGGEVVWTGSAQAGAIVGVPTVSDLTAFLAASGLTTTADLQFALDEAYLRWCDLAGSEFAKEANDSTHFYNPPKWGSHGCFLDLRSYYSSITSITYGCDYDGTGGTVMTEGVEYVLEPYGSGPWTKVQFVNAPYGYPRSIKVIGKRGYAADWPSGSVRAFLAGAAAFAYDDGNASSQGLVSIEQGEVKMQYSVTNQQLSNWRKDFERGAKRYNLWL